MGKIASLIRNILAKLFISARRFPQPLFCALLTVTTMIIQIHSDNTAQAFRDVLTKAAMTFALGIPLALSLNLFFERFPASRRAKLLAYGIAAAGLALYYLMLPPKINANTTSRYLAINLALYLLTIFLPYFYRRANFERYVVRLLSGFATTYLYSIILYIGLTAILFTLNKLFGLNWPRLYIDLWVLVVGIFAPAYFLADVPEYNREIEADYYPKLLQVLLLYIVMPLILVYTAILYVYFAKIVLTRTWPVGIVANLVVWYAFISIIVIFLTFPLRNNNVWCQKFSAVFPRFVPPLLVMMFLAMAIRIQAYGVTENRYFVLAGGIWTTASFIYFLLSRRSQNIVLPISLAIVAILTVTGPWSSYAVSKFSQNHRLTSILTKYGMLEGRSIVQPRQELPLATKREIGSILWYFKENHRLKDVRLLPANFEIKDMDRVFGFKYESDPSGRFGNQYFDYSFLENRVQSIDAYQYLLDLTGLYHREYQDLRLKQQTLIFNYTRDHQLTLQRQGKILYTKDLNKLATMLIKREHPKIRDVKSLTYEEQSAHVAVRYIFKTLRGNEDIATGTLNFNDIDYYLLVKVTP